MTNSKAGGARRDWVEVGAKAVGLLSASAVATALLFDCVYYWSLDRRLLGLLVLWDHTETAVRYILPIILTSGFILGAGFFAARFCQRNRRFRRVQPLVTLVVMFIVAVLVAYGVTVGLNKEAIGDVLFNIGTRIVEAWLLILAFAVSIAGYSALIILKNRGPHRISSLSLSFFRLSGFWLRF
jgi:hypothetical protein